MRNTHSTRLYCILARDAPVGVIFRRGPSKQVCLIKWDLKSDTFEVGQWFKGRIYERRCDLSPNGDKLVYFAYNETSDLGAWTGISKIPYFTALALWPNIDTYGGGGLFLSDQSVLINTAIGDIKREDPKLPKGFEVQQQRTDYASIFHEPGWGSRLVRDGWTLEGKNAAYKSSPVNENTVLCMQIVSVGAAQKPWYDIDYFIVDAQGKDMCVLENVGWADWDKNGDLLYTKDGKVFRVNGDDGGEGTELIDLSDMSFEKIRSPESARRW